MTPASASRAAPTARLGPASRATAVSRGRGRTARSHDGQGDCRGCSAAAAKASCRDGREAASPKAATKAQSSPPIRTAQRGSINALPTHETDRGLVSEIGGVQFATGTANLNSAARESLARLSGIVASYPDLKFAIVGHTDNAGLPDNNERAFDAACDRRSRLPRWASASRTSNIDAQGRAPRIRRGQREPEDERAIAAWRS